MADETDADNGSLPHPRVILARAHRDSASRSGSASSGLAGLSRLVEDAPEIPTGQLERIVQTAVAEVDGARWATITVVDDGGLVTRAWTDRVARLIDQAQQDNDDGPIVTIPATPGAMVHSCDLVADRRWPRFAPLAHRLGVGAALCHRIGRQSRPAGVLSVYADRAQAFSVDSDRVSRLLALYAGVALDSEAVHRNLRATARSRDLIGQAKGILMERLDLPADQAFATLVGRAAARRRRLHEVADHLICTGELL